MKLRRLISAGAGLAVTPDVVSSYYAEAEKLHDNIKQRLAEEFKQQKSVSAGRSTWATGSEGSIP